MLGAPTPARRFLPERKGLLPEPYQRRSGRGPLAIMMHEQLSDTTKFYARAFRNLPVVLVFALALLQIAGAAASRPAQRPTVRASRVAPRSPANGTEFAWLSRLNGSGAEVSWDAANDVAFLPDGRIAATGTLQMATGEFAFAVAVYHHDGALDWFRTMQGTAAGWDSEGMHVAVDALGNVVAVGLVHDTVLTPFTARPAPRPRRGVSGHSESTVRPAVMAISFTGDGAERWRTRITSPSNGEIRPLDIALDRVNNLLIAGYSENGQSSSDFLVAKLLGSDGHIAWERLVDGGSGFPDAAQGVTTVPSADAGEQDDVVVTGYFSEGEFGSRFAAMKIDGDFGLTDHWIKRVDLMNEPVAGTGHDVATDAAGNVVIAGWLAPSGEAREFAVVKLSGATGDQDWIYIYPTQSTFTDDVATDVAIDSQNQVVAAGNVATEGNGYDHLIVKLNSGTGSATWTRQIAEAGDQEVRDLALDAHDFIVSAMVTTIGEAHQDFEVVRYSPTGTLNWRRTYAGTAEAEDVARAVDTDPFGNIAVAGFTEEVSTGRDFTVALIDCQVPTLLDPFLSPTELLAAGGDVQAKVLAVDNLGIDRVEAVVFHPDESETRVQLGETLADKYEGSIPIPENLDSVPKYYLVEFEATDINGNTNRLPGIQVTVAGVDDVSPVIIDCALGTDTLPVEGGLVPIDATIVDNVAVEYVQALVIRPDTTSFAVPLEPGSENDFSADIPIPLNPDPVEKVYTVKLFAYDAVGNETHVDCGTITQEAADGVAPEIVSCSVDPTELPHTGGQINLTAVITDNVGVGAVKATVTPAGGSPVDVPLTRGSGDNWSALFTLAGNAASMPVVYTVALKAEDAAGNSTSQDCGTVTVAAPDTTAPVISAPVVTPDSLTADGGTVTIRATVNDNVGVDQVTAEVSLEPPVVKGKKGKKRNRPRSAAVIAQVPLTHVGNNVYEGQFTAPANDTLQTVTYTVAIRAQDASGNQATEPGGSFTVAAYVPGRIQITPATLNFGLVDLNDTVQREFTIRNIGKGFLTAEMTNLGDPFRILLKKDTPTPLGDGERYYFGLAPGESLQVRVEFRPVRHARYPAEIRIFSNDAKKKVARVQIRAFGCELRRR